MVVQCNGCTVISVCVAFSGGWGLIMDTFSIIRRVSKVKQLSFRCRIVQRPRPSAFVIKNDLFSSYAFNQCHKLALTYV